MFLDASAIVAILTREAGHDALTASLAQAERPRTSPLAIFEAALGIRRKRYCAVAEAEQDVRAFLEIARVNVVPIADADGHGALDAFSRFGKGTGHPAQLNMGDCFAYAVARNIGATILFAGEGFSKTDAPTWRSG